MAAESKTKSPLPAAGKTFYIDEVDLAKSKLHKLEKSLRLLGAKLENFFTKDIYCLVTDHGQPSDYVSRARGSDGKGATPSPFGCTPGSNAAAPSDAGSSSTMNCSSRAARMLMKSQQTNNRRSGGNSTSMSEQLVRNARQWSIKMIDTETAQQWADRKISAFKLSHKPRKSRERSERLPKVKGKVLKAPFIKIEDKSGSYKPIYRQLTCDAVPMLNTDADNSPFAAAAAYAVAEHTDRTADAALNTSKVEGEKGGKGKRSAKVKAAAAKPVKKKLTFCMACKVGYDDLDQHLRSDQHKKYAQDSDNFKAVDELISKNANMQRFLDDIMTYHPVHREEGLAQDEETSKSASTSTLRNDGMDAPPLSPLELVHRSVSDSGASDEDLTILPLGDQGSVGTRGSLPSIAQQSERVDGELNAAPDKSSVAGDCEDATEVAAVEDIKPNISKVVVRPKNIISSDRKLSPQKNHSKKSSPPDKSNSCKARDNSDISDSNMSPSEIVKLRKRGKSNQQDKKLAVEQKTKAVKDRKSRKSIAATQAHWALLSGQGHEGRNDDTALPVDVSYGTLDEQQLKTMANQRQSLGVSDVDNISLVQSIHSFLQETFTACPDDPADVPDTEDPLLSCDNYISDKLSKAGQSNMMLEPVTPRKSPRVCLGARDLHDEHFSPEKRRLSQSMEKMRRSSEDLHTDRKRIRKFDLERSLSLPAPVVEDKENLSAMETSCQPSVSPCPSAASDTSLTACRRQSFISPDASPVEVQPLSEVISTPLPDSQHLDDSGAIISSTPTAENIKKSLFTMPTPVSTQKPNPTSTQSPRVRRKRRRSKWSSAKTEVASPNYADCFGFEENANSNNNNPRRELISCSPRTHCPQFARKFSTTHSKADYDRQNSLLSFGSKSLTEFDDVFAQPPKLLTATSASASKNSPRIAVVPCRAAATVLPLRRSPRKKRDYFGFSDDDLAAPGFKVNSKTRKAAENSQRTRDVETTPKRRKCDQAEHNNSPRGTRRSARTSGVSATELDYPLSRIEWKLRSPPRPKKRSWSDNNQPCGATSGRPNKSPNASQKQVTPTVDDTLLDHRSISMCTSLAPSDCLDISQQLDDSTDCRSVVSSTPSYRSLPDSATDYILKHKYGYTVGSRSNGSRQFISKTSQDT